MSITLTKSAANRISSHLNANAEHTRLRVAVKTSGCSGYAYQLAYVDEIESDDCVFESHGVSVVVKQEHMEILAGIELDYIEDGLSSTFKFNNPNVTSECGCGESFTVN